MGLIQKNDKRFFELCRVLQRTRFARTFAP